MVKDPKLCPKCEKYKPRSEFRPRTGHKNAVSSWCKVCCLKQHNKWYRENREYVLANSAQWRKDNPEQYKKSLRNWRQNNKQRKIELEHRRRARKQDNAVYNISPKDLRKLLGPCSYCGLQKEPTMDHVIPISRGGSHGIGNLVPCCLSCNTTKNNRTVMEWRMNKPRPYSGKY
jgi:5-methylcytosine-specific restriction endonuclease McrA